MERRFSGNRFGDRGFGDSSEKPVKQDETYDVEIKEVGTRGDGIARVKNFVIFVANTQKGEKCKIKITQVSRRFAIAEKVGEAKGIKEEPEEDLEELSKEVDKELEEKVEDEPEEELEGEAIED
jgi:predicted RNA-binding protein with TRAM domain